ncbi:hypothetical protein K6V78_09970 [Streptococcus gallolyticus]|uniref:hypothetical protein n=1 Tax=Streptococcus hepaticus TaxID=3349163 RepID=UPI001C971760|nr:hypothetical protein [Streptococcus gallolyticus]MBY5041862.1 hypothetical protein [Streptococcus gallolyticus]
MRKSNKPMIFISLGLLLVTALGVFVGQALSPKKPISKKIKEAAVSQLEIGKTYEIYGELTLIDEQHYVYLFDDTDYESQEELEEVQEENYPDQIYPALYYYQGEYKREGDNIYLKPTKEISIFFETLADVKKKTYFQVTETALTGNFEDQAQLIKKDGVYMVSLGADDDNFQVIPSSAKLAKSSAEFLANYTKANKKD